MRDFINYNNFNMLYMRFFAVAADGQILRKMTQKIVEKHAIARA
jgi:hypothetical protein